MGRKSLNRTYEEMLELQRARANNYYSLHKEEIKKKKMEKYYKLKQASLKNDKSK